MRPKSTRSFLLALALAAAALLPTSAAPNKEQLLKPDTLTEKAPDKFRAKVDTSKGAFVIEVTRDWSPNGADRFYNLVKNGWYDGVRFFRVVPGFMVQFGIGGDPELNKIWMNQGIPDDAVKGSNKKGYVTYAKSGAPNSRTTQIFINFGDNSRLDTTGFSPFGLVVEGMDVVEKLNGEFGDGPPQGRGPNQGRLQAEGNAYLEKEFPTLDFVKAATIQKGEAKGGEKAPAAKAPGSQKTK